MSNKLYDEDTMMGDYFGDDKPVANDINTSELKPCPFCGSTKIRKPKNEKGWLCKKCGSEIFWDWNTRPIEDALNEQIKELEAEHDEMKVMVEKLIKVGNKLSKFTLILDSLLANRYVDDWIALVTEWKEREE